jgi:hypothetical protein
VIWVVWREHGRMKGSDAYVEARQASVWLVGEGGIVRCTTSFNIDEARAAAERLAQERG